MNIKKLIISVLIILSVSTCVVLFALPNQTGGKIDLVAVNDIAESYAMQWGELGLSEHKGLQYGLDYVVIDNSGKLLKATRPGLNETIDSAISHRDTIVDIKADNKMLGKLIIYNNSDEIWNKYRNHLLAFALFVVFTASAFCLAYATYIDRAIFRPFRRLQGFARNVAEGKLDTPLDMDKNNLFGAFTESFDLMRVELDKARECERMANQSKKELVASLSHDIKTPVSSIKAVCELMHTKSNIENEKKQLEIVIAKADQIDSLITNMFDATLEELQELKATATEQSSQLLNDLIKNVDYNKRVIFKGISECIILVDELRLAQVIDNIISNSYKYANTSIEVSSRIKENYLEILFKDFGLGLLDDDLPLLFNKYYRAKNAVGKSGAGLGLYISKYLMNKMSGDIECSKTIDGFEVKIKLLIA
ncbi:MAG TPA: HAMP domain-containing sensor histidine kinase [Bacillota bacterium]|nr:HAMP domain-containing sensor histidine kinase [Bacillota bacterium]